LGEHERRDGGLVYFSHGVAGEFRHLDQARVIPANLRDIYGHLIQGAGRNEVNRLDDANFGGAELLQKAG